MRVVFGCLPGTPTECLQRATRFFVRRFLSPAVLNPVQFGLLATNPNVGPQKALEYVALVAPHRCAAPE